MGNKILIVDDEQEICEILKYNLQVEGYEVDVAFSATEALNYDLASYSLIVLDIMMDTISGFELARRLKKNPCHILFCDRDSFYFISTTVSTPSATRKRISMPAKPKP